MVASSFGLTRVNEASFTGKGFLENFDELRGESDFGNEENDGLI